MKFGALASAMSIAWLSGSSPAWAQTAASLGSAQSYAVLGATTVTNTGPSVISGDLGVSPGAAVVGFPPGIVGNGTIHAADASAGAARASAMSAYTFLQGQPSTANLTGQDLGTVGVLTPGVYTFNVAAALTGSLTLNAQGDPNAVFIFQIGSTLTSASNASVNLINGGSLCNVFWAVGSSATLGTNTAFVGNILAVASITLNTGANLQGRALAQNAAVTLDTNNVSTAACFSPTGAGCVSGSVAPTISAIPNQVIAAVSGSIGVGFTISGAVIADALRVTATSANSTLVPQSAMVITRGAGGARVLSITGADGRSGVTTITITVTDPGSGCSTSASFQLSIGPTAVPTLPEWAMIALSLLLVGGGYAVVRRRAL